MNVKTQIKKLKDQEYKLSQKRRKLEDIDYLKNEENRISSLIGKFFQSSRLEDYIKGEYGRVISYKWIKENGRKSIEITSEYLGFFDWQTVIQRGTLTDFRVNWNDFDDRWSEIIKVNYYEKYNGALKILNLKDKE